MTTKLLFVRDGQGFNSFGVMTSDKKYSTSLVANVEQSLTTPIDDPRYLAVFSCSTGGNFWVAINENATTAGSSFAFTNSDLNPPALRVEAGDQLNFITLDTNIELNVKFYSGIS